MGVYIFNWRLMKAFLIEDEQDKKSSHDFGKNIIPKMLASQQLLFAYAFTDYWKDVGTVQSYWEANMDLLDDNPSLNLYDNEWKIYSVNATRPPHFVDETAKIKRSLISEGCIVLGQVENSVVFPGVYIGQGAMVKDSVIMSDTKVSEGAKINKAIVGSKAIIREGCLVGAAESPTEITVVEEETIISSGGEALT
jgi:glucose-1-phosphate adenylyltransferase